MACVVATKTKRWKESGSDDNADDSAGGNNADEADDYDDADGKCDGDHDEDAVSKNRNEVCNNYVYETEKSSVDLQAS